ncbi:DUF4296 domain-containing protein [Maribacter sp. 2307ULW6-5]|uniref:DUF4296 domain-containing protein n=1 Tax=Maribacter sp. 2307ULW6-5 TaxID=3386275 RepID=UPI0039BCB89F
MGKLKTFLMAGLAALLFSCGEKLIEPPENVIPKDKMVLMLKELAVLNAARTTSIAKLKEYGIDPTSYVFEKFGVDSLQFVESDRYYASLPAQYEDIYLQVEALLTQEKERVDALKKMNDSLEAVEKRDALSAEKDTL